MCTLPNCIYRKLYFNAKSRTSCSYQCLTKLQVQIIRKYFPLLFMQFRGFHKMLPSSFSCFSCVNGSVLACFQIGDISILLSVKLQFDTSKLLSLLKVELIPTHSVLTKPLSLCPNTHNSCFHGIFPITYFVTLVIFCFATNQK